MLTADRWFGDIPQQFLGRKNIEVLINAFARQMQELEQVFDDLDTKTDLDAAGQNLDYVGTIIPLTRKEAGELAGMNDTEPVISDERYRQYLRYKMLQNTSDCTYYDIMQAIEILWDASKALYYEREERPATIFIGLPTVNVEEEDPAIGKPDILKPAGVGFYYTVQYVAVFDHSSLEKFRVAMIKIHMYASFFGIRLLNGSWHLDGSALLDAQRRYMLRHGLKIGIRSYIEEFSQSRLIVISCGLRWPYGKEYIMHTFVHLAGLVKMTQSDPVTRIRIHTVIEQNAGRDPEVTLATKRNVWHLDGQVLLDGSRIINALDRKEIL